jgi:hypothetical protein
VLLLEQLIDRQPASLVVVGSATTKLFVPLIEMLRNLFDDLRLATLAERQ